MSDRLTDLRILAERARTKRIERARNGDIRQFCELVMINEETGKGIDMAPFHMEWHRLADEYDRLLIWSSIEHGKALDVATPIPGPNGWKDIGDLAIGDTIFDRYGARCNVTGKSKVFTDHQMYRVSFADGSFLIADEDHRWVVRKVDCRKVSVSEKHAGDGEPCKCGCGLHAKIGKIFIHNHHRRTPEWGVFTTRELIDLGLRTKSLSKRKDGSNYHSHKWHVPVASCVDYPRQDLPIHPYVLGAWLGDGSSDINYLTCHSNDRGIATRCVELEGGHYVRSDKRNTAVETWFLGQLSSGNHDPKSIRDKLRRLGLFGNKHIPSIYLQGAEDQRRELLAGLLDTDGHTPEPGLAEFSSSCQELAEGALELIRSLGYRASIRDKEATLNGKPCGTAWTVVFAARDQPVFWINRKSEIQAAELDTTQHRKAKAIISIEPAQQVNAQCISVDSQDNTYLAGRSYTVTHNTQQMAIARTLWDLGQNPNLRNVICSSTKGQSKKISRSIKEYIEGSEALHSIFPDLLPGTPWGENDFTVKRKTHAKDPSVQCTGLHGNILGARIDRLVLDDILNYENTRTAHARKDVKDWVKSTLLGRLTKNARVRNIGNAWHPGDILHEFAKMKSWKAFVYSALLEDGTPRWPEAWSPERIEKKREELGPVEFARQLLCQARDDSSSTFKRAWIERCLALGDGREMARALSTIPRGYQVYTGVDLAVQKHSAADETCFFTIAVDPFGLRHVLEVDTERISGPEIVEKIKSVHRRFNSIVIVENNAAQDFVLQFTRGSSAVPVFPFTTGQNKADPSHGVQSLATEMYNGKWSIPSAENGDKLHPEIAAWVDEMLYYDPAGHTGDRLMACVAPGHSVTTKRGLIPIEHVVEGDEVLTHKSRFRRVTGVASRDYEGEAVRVKPSGMHGAVFTSEHPIWSAASKFDRTNRTNRLIPRDWDWRDASELRSGRKLEGMYVLSPDAAWDPYRMRIDLSSFRATRSESWGGRWHIESDKLNWRNERTYPRFLNIDEELGIAIGLYVASGYGNGHQSSFSLNQSEKYLAEFVSQMAKERFGASSTIDTRGEKGITVHCDGVLMARFFGQIKARDKRSIPWKWMGWPLSVRMAIVRGWLIRDGCLIEDGRGHSKLRGVTVAKQWLEQARLTLHEAGFLASHEPFPQSGYFQGKPCSQLPAWRLRMTASCTERFLSSLSPLETLHWECVSGQVRERTNARMLRLDIGTAVRLASVEKFQYSGPIHNLHVEEDESFVVEGIAVHNSWFAREGARMKTFNSKIKSQKKPDFMRR